MNGFLATALSLLLLYKYVALFVISYLAALLLPLPSGTSLMAASAFATQGYFSFPLVFLVALLGNILGDLTGFFVARRYGKKFLITIGLRKMLESPKYIGLEKYIEDKAPLTIFATRFISQLGPLVNIFAGLASMSFVKYFIYESTGEFFYVLVYAGAGYILGTQWQSAAGIIGFIVVALAFTAFVIMFTRSYFKDIKKQSRQYDRDTLY